jgi:hypothetical protein
VSGGQPPALRPERSDSSIRERIGGRIAALRAAVTNWAILKNSPEEAYVVTFIDLADEIGHMVIGLEEKLDQTTVGLDDTLKKVKEQTERRLEAARTEQENFRAAAADSVRFLKNLREKEKGHVEQVAIDLTRNFLKGCEPALKARMEAWNHWLMVKALCAAAFTTAFVFLAGMTTQHFRNSQRDMAVVSCELHVETDTDGQFCRLRLAARAG